MELWIRSQSREELIKIHNVSINNDNYIIGNIISDDNKSICDYWILGMYDTKERALEVLDEIQQRLIDLQTLEIASDFYKETKRCLDNVYEMPKE